MEPEFLWLCHGQPRCDLNEDISYYEGGPRCAYCYRTCLHDERSVEEITADMERTH